MSTSAASPSSRLYGLTLDERRGRPLVAFGVAIVLLTTLALGALALLNSARTFPAQGGLISTFDRSVVGKRYFTSLVWASPTEGPVYVHSLSPRVVENSSRSTVRVLECEGGTVGGADESSIGATCSRLTPFRPGPFHASETRSLVHEVVARQPGRLRIQGADIDFRDGIKRGAYQAGGTLTITTPR